MSRLLFRTPPGGVSIPTGQRKVLGVVDVTAYSKIRVFAAEGAGSPTGVTFRLTLTEGNEWFAPLDTFDLTAGSNITRVYEVPGSIITLVVDALDGSGLDVVLAAIYGS